MREDVAMLLFRHRKTIDDERKVLEELRKIQNKCEHKTTHVVKFPLHPNRIFCSDCAKDLGEECLSNKGHPHDFDYEYDGNEYHQPCKKCGKIWEDCKW